MSAKLKLFNTSNLVQVEAILNFTIIHLVKIMYTAFSMSQCIISGKYHLIDITTPVCNTHTKYPSVKCDMLEMLVYDCYNEYLNVSYHLPLIVCKMVCTASNSIYMFFITCY